jgi:hypothetical protein
MIVENVAPVGVAKISSISVKMIEDETGTSSVLVIMVTVGVNVSSGPSEVAVLRTSHVNDTSLAHLVIGE